MKIQTSMLVSQMAGSLNGSSVRRSRYGLVLQQKASGLQSNTTSLGIRRSVFASIAFAWNILDPSEKAQWQTHSEENPQSDRFGNAIILSGYNYFVKIQNFLHTVDFAFVRADNYSNLVDTINSLSVRQISSNTFEATADLTGNSYTQRAVFFAVRVPKGSASPFLNYKQFLDVRDVSSATVVGEVDIRTFQAPIPEQWYIGCFIVTENGGVSPTVLAPADW